MGISLRKAGDLFNIKEITKLSMEKGGLDVEAHNLVVVIVCICEEYPRAGEFDDRGIHFCKVHTLSLTKSLRYQPRLFFTPFDGSIRVVLVYECPTDADGFAVLRYRCYPLKGTSMLKAVLLTLHRS